MLRGDWRVSWKPVASDKLLDYEEHRIGSVYQWYPVVKLISDNRLAPKDKRSIDIDLSSLGSGGYNIKIEAEKWRITEENLAYHGLEDSVPSHVVFDHRNEKITIP